MGSLRCASCRVSWPEQPKVFGSCPECGNATWYSVGTPIDQSEANHKAFEAFYARHRQAQSLKRDEVMARLEHQIETGGAHA